ncbi:MAG TPA: RsmE family RNA methyltransferase [Candidatus Dormibacteraeota bacterium]
MPRFFISSDDVEGANVVLGPDAATHLAGSLRVRPGDEVVVVEDGRREHGIIVEEVARHRVTGRIAWTRPAGGDPLLRIHVVQAIPAQGMDLAVEALAEIGVAAVWPVITDRGVARPDLSRATGRVERWHTIAREAAQLAGRASVPDIQPVQPLSTAVGMLPAGCRILACVVDAAATPLATISLDPNAPVAVVVGPEGGLSPADLAVLDAAGAEAVHLGPRVIRSRLAGFFAASLLLAAAGELNTAVATERPE